MINLSFITHGLLNGIIVLIDTLSSSYTDKCCQLFSKYRTQ